LFGEKRGLISSSKEVKDMPMTMPKILDCDATACSYNKNKECHAMAITVGSPAACAFCDTFFKSEARGGVSDMTGGVGACRMSNCKFNTSLECSARGIHVALHSDHAECTTFTAR
jgi:hypothetical protein